MALVAMAIYDTESNDRSRFTEQALDSLVARNDFRKHRLFLIDNASCQRTKDLIDRFCRAHYGEFNNGQNLTVITNETNLGTAEAINLAWKHRQPGEHAIKMDNDMVVDQDGWIDLLEEAANRDPKIGQVGIKRKDCWENPKHENPFYRSELVFLPHELGQTWILAEKVNHVMGSAVLHTNNLLNRIGYMWQPGLYGFDDSLMSHRSRLAGFYNIFLSNIPAEHIDKGENPYQKEKERSANADFPAYHKALNDFNKGLRPLKYDPFQ